LHDNGPTAATWTTVNLAEALPGIPTPLGWTWFFEGCELGMRQGLADLGVIAKREVRICPDLDDRFHGIFYGRAAANLDFVARLGDQIPGSSGKVFEEAALGGARSDRASSRDPRRLAAVAVRSPISVALLRRRLGALEAEINQWWRVTVALDPTPVEARRHFDDARTYWIRTMRVHSALTAVSIGCFDMLGRICAKAGKPGLELTLVRSGREISETRMIEHLRATARGSMTMTDFLAKHGYHGPAEGELSSHSWREDPSPLHSLLAAYRDIDGAGRPSHDAADVDRAAADLRAQLGPLEGRMASLVVRLARTFVPLREAGRGTFLKAFDVARCMARHVGADLVREGRLDEVEDVFFLTADELVDPAGVPDKAVVAERKASRQRYLSLELPSRWIGPVTPSESSGSATQSDDGNQLAGLGVSPGVVEGRAVVIHDPSDAGELTPGDILVCRTTDPSWAALFFVAGGVVIDIGAAMSHGAIVARELGLPCVINAGDATKRLRTGDAVRIDGATGVVQVLSQTNRRVRTIDGSAP
jgi:pyruvate,water dikinase